MKACTKLLNVLIGIIILTSSCTGLTEWMSGEEDDSTPPAEVSNLQAEALDASVRLTWTDPIDSDFDHVTIEYNIVPEFVEIVIIDKGQEEVLIEELMNQEYTFLVYTGDDVGNATEGIEIKATPFYTIPN